MTPIPKIIVDFLHNQTVATVSCLDQNNTPHSFSCFFTVEIQQGLLLFKSDLKSRHTSLFYENMPVSGTVVANNIDRDGFKGIQFTGNLIHPHQNGQDTGIRYHYKFPFASLFPGIIYAIRLTSLKFSNMEALHLPKTLWTNNMDQLINS